METTFQYQPTQALTLELSGSYNDSRITENFYSGVLQVSKGERLPYVPYFSWSSNARYEQPIKDSLHVYAQFDIAHKGDLWNALLTDGSNGLPRVLQPGYSTMNLRFGVTDVEAKWFTEIYVTNLTNKNAVIYTNEGNYDLRQTRNEPRVFGARVSYRWGGKGER
jgi:iron complex outermembrane recepter protein